MSHLTNLSICGGEKRYCEEAEILAPTLPQRTDHYVPVSHMEVLDLVRKEVATNGLDILQSVHSLARKGQRYFGLMQVQSAQFNAPDLGFVIGIRNSYDKSIPASIACGNQVFVCDNLMFNGEVVLGRRHTLNVWNDLPRIVADGVRAITKRWKVQTDRLTHYKASPFGDRMADSFIVDVFRKGLLQQTQIADVIRAWYEPPHKEFEARNAYSLHNAFSEAWKNQRPDTLIKPSVVLHRELDLLTGFSES